MYYIGIDLGTSAVKLLMMDEKGHIAKIVNKEYPIEFPHPGWSQQNPEDWYEKSVEGLKELTADIDPKQVAGISFGGQMHGLVILDGKDQVIRPAILWNDGRTVKETDYLNHVIGKDKLSEYTANIAFAGFTAPKLLWVKANEPENFARIKKIMLPKDYLAYRLTGTFCTDLSDASGMLLLDVKNRRWAPEMLRICGITEDMLSNGAMTADYGAVLALTETVTDLLSRAHTARLEKDGHVLTLDLTGRPGIASPGVYRLRGQSGNLPSGEAYIAPLENGSNGTMCIDGSMVGVGLLTEPLVVTVENGRLVSIEGREAQRLEILLRNERNATLCELGIGTNHAARLTGVILEDEKAFQTVHIAFGTNTGFGGANKADCHIDGVIRDPTLYLDDRLILDRGVFVI